MRWWEKGGFNHPEWRHPSPAGLSSHRHLALTPRLCHTCMCMAPPTAAAAPAVPPTVSVLLWPPGDRAHPEKPPLPVDTNTQQRSDGATPRHSTREPLRGGRPCATINCVPARAGATCGRRRKGEPASRRRERWYRHHGMALLLAARVQDRKLAYPTTTVTEASAAAPLDTTTHHKCSHLLSPAPCALYTHQLARWASLGAPHLRLSCQHRSSLSSKYGSTHSGWRPCRHHSAMSAYDFAHPAPQSGGCTEYGYPAWRVV